MSLMNHDAQDEVEIISPEDAEAILRPEIDQLLAEGWRLKHQSSFAARLVREYDVIDLQVDLLGQLDRQQKLAVVSSAEVGRLVAWVLLLTSLLVSLTLAGVLGLI